MRVNLSADEVSVLRNALATRHDDLRDQLGQWAEDAAMADSENLERAEWEMEVVLALGAKLPRLDQS